MDSPHLVHARRRRTARVPNHAVADSLGSLRLSVLTTVLPSFLQGGAGAAGISWYTCRSRPGVTLGVRLPKDLKGGKGGFMFCFLLSYPK